jgi:D-serine dehydratase
MDERAPLNPLAVIGGLILGLAAICLLFSVVDALFNDATASKGRLLARKERHVIEKAEYYERGVEYERVEFLKAEVHDPKRFTEVYGKSKLML